MADKNIVNIGSIKDAIDYRQPDPAVINIGGDQSPVYIEVKKSLTIFETQEFVRDVINMLFYDVDGAGNEEYYASLKRFVIDYNVVDYFTNIELGDSYEEAWAFLVNTDVVRMVVGEIDPSCLENLINSANEMIEYKKKKLLHRRRMDDVLGDAYNSFGDILNKIGSVDPEDALKLIGENAPDIKEELIHLAKEKVSEKDIK